MTCLGFKTIVIKWSGSYLSSGKFFGSLDDIFSGAGILICGIPQGFILQPLLFFIHIGDLLQPLPESSSLC